MRQGDTFKRKYYKTRSSSYWEKYRVMRNRVVTMRRNAMKAHFKHLCEEKQVDQKNFWSTIKPHVHLRKNAYSGHTIVLIDKDQIIEINFKCAKPWVISSRVVKNDARNVSLDLSHIAQNRPEAVNISLTNFNAMEVKDVLSKVKPNKATGCDLTPLLGVNQSADVLCYPFRTLIDHIITKGSIPQQWKLGQITSVHKKKKCPEEKSDYRPISILPSLSKFFETSIHSRVSPDLERIYHKYVFAYRKHLGCDTALLALTEKLKKERDNHKIKGLFSMDWSKAFDTLPHDLIVSKLRHYGANEKTLSLLKDYLSNPLWRVKLGDRNSTWQEGGVGVPQGSILGPILFNMVFNDLVYAIKSCNLSTYAGETQIFAAETEPDKLQQRINTDLAAIDRWYDANGMKRNHSKYQAMVGGSLQTLKSKFHWDNKTIPVSEDLTLLGVTIDNWNSINRSPMWREMYPNSLQYWNVWETFYLLI